MDLFDDRRSEEINSESYTVGHNFDNGQVELSPGYQFIRSPSKRKFFEKDNLNNIHLNGSISPSKLDKMETAKNDRGDSDFTGPVEKSMHQDRPQELDLQKEQMQTNYVANVLTESGKFEENPIYNPTTTPAYTKLQFSSVQAIFEDAEKGGSSGEPSRILLPPSDDTITEALIAVFFSSFYIIFSIGITYSHYLEGKTVAAKLTLLILAISSFVTLLCYLFNRKLKKSQMWKTSKIFTLLTLVPGLLPLFLSLTDLVFALKESRSRSYTRPWVNTRPIYLVESLFLALPLCLLHIVLLMEDVNSMPSVKGFIVVFSCAALVIGMTFARVRYDCDPRTDRFGSGTEKVINTAIIFGHKGLWVITYAILAVSVRIRSTAENQTFATVIALVGLTLLYEIPVLLPALQCCNKFVKKAFGMFFFIPQFASLVVIILWTNTDVNIYTTDIGIVALGSYTLFESLALMGWLLDSCNDRDMDILPIYPHFFGDLYDSKKPKQTVHV